VAALIINSFFVIAGTMCWVCGWGRIVPKLIFRGYVILIYPDLMGWIVEALKVGYAADSETLALGKETEEAACLLRFVYYVLLRFGARYSTRVRSSGVL
jgi:hypothetical protein